MAKVKVMYIVGLVGTELMVARVMLSCTDLWNVGCNYE